MRLNRLFVLLFLAACDGSVLDPDDVHFAAVVDEVPEPQVNVGFQVKNLADRTVYVLDHCAEVVTPWLERREGSEWVPIANGAPCFAIAMPPIELEPDESAEGSLALHEPGQYRAVLHVTADLDSEDYETLYREFTVAD